MSASAGLTLPTAAARSLDRFTGGKSYRLHVPPNPAAKQFWSVTVYDEATRGFIVTDTKSPDISSWKADLAKNPDGSVDVYFGPTAPPGKASNWIKTLPGQGYFLYFRFYAPIEPIFSKTWALDDVQPVK